MVLFPDAREKQQSITQLNEFVRALPRGPERRVTTLGLSTAFYPAHYSSAHPLYLEGRFTGVDADPLLRCLADTDLAHPMHVVYREGDDVRWSETKFGLVTPKRLRD